MRTILQVILISLSCVTVSAIFTRKTFRLQVTEDVWIERPTTNYNHYPWLLLGTHRGFPLKRSLMKFQNIPCECTLPCKATLHLYFVYAHKASFMSTTQVPAIKRYVVAHTVRKYWRESQATTTKRYNGANWSQAWLNLGADAKFASSPATEVSPSPGHKWYTVDVTEQAIDWKFGSNYGLLLRDTRERVLGRDFRFASNAYKDKTKHAYIILKCWARSTPVRI